MNPESKSPWGLKITIFLLVFACLFIGYQYFKLKVAVNTPQIVSVHDTIYIDKPYRVEVPGITKVKLVPYKVIVYAKDPATPSTVHYGNLDSLQNLADSLHWQNDLMKTYATWYATYDKSQLLNLNLSQDSLRLVLFDKEGVVKDKRYGLTLGTYNYQYYNDDLYTEKVPITKQPLAITYDLHGGYDFFGKSPFIGGEAGIGKGSYSPVFVRVDFSVLHLTSQSSFQLGFRLIPKVWPIKIR
jgi:hypothetical protein